MSTFFVDKLEKITVIEGEDALHISKAQRSKCGDKLNLSDGNGLRAVGEIKEIGKSSVMLEIEEIFEDENEPKVGITLFQAMPKGDKAELIIQKAVELGVSKIVFFLSEFCVSRPTQKDFDKKLIRYNKIALEAAKQCGRGKLVPVVGIITFKELAELVQNAPTAFLYEKASLPYKAVLERAKAEGALNIIIGSEGGFSEKEVEALKIAGAEVVTLGKLILRCETAAIAAIAAAGFYFLD